MIWSWNEKNPTMFKMKVKPYFLSQREFPTKLLFWNKIRIEFNCIYTTGTHFPTMFSKTEDLPALWPPTTAICGRSICSVVPVDVTASLSSLMTAIKFCMPSFRAPMVRAPDTPGIFLHRRIFPAKLYARVTRRLSAGFLRTRKKLK